MNECLEQSLELVKAQAAVRPMTEDEMLAMLGTLTQRLEAMSRDDAGESAAPEEAPAPDPKRSIRAKNIVCLECGRSFRFISKRHLAVHGLDAAAYREKWGLKKGTPLTCRELQKQRRETMRGMRLWERRGQAGSEEA